ncbi:glycosyltransferase family 4 protein [Mucilaginibacter pedocola]|uniref:Glycosyl transferase family 1 n=1 Tax=Mucilaginibacter pedocola TaxID=1792845 RepID=A0A1S9P8F8_9SPHI|nr:glycosyltransferase family 4 protein [Mucilaginibacter pedocola]OOQ57222.1 glycosyl transferase family 1 [Mucilaginibacter pedocola]
MKIVLSHPTGNEFVRGLIKELSAQGMLAEFDTTVAANPSSPWLKLLPGNLRQEWLRRTYPVPQSQVNSYPFREISRMLMPRLGLKSAVKQETGWASVDAVYRGLDGIVAKRLRGMVNGNKPDAVYAYEDGALQSFGRAKKQGINCLYDLPIGYWRAAREMLGAERERWPDWAATLTGLRDSEAKLARKDEEIKLADAIFVASSFTKNTLSYYPGALPPVSVVPYAFPPVVGQREYKAGKGPLKLLFVGGLSQRKGIADMFAAVERLGSKVQLTVVGSKLVDNCAVLNEALAKHRYIPSLPHAGVLKLMREHDVLLFPSLFEGFGLVITEAMAQGTPVITTDRTAGPDVITHGEDGWLIPAGSTEKLIQAIEDILARPAIVEQAGRAAMNTAAKRTWDTYGAELVAAIIRNN